MTTITIKKPNGDVVEIVASLTRSEVGDLLASAVCGLERSSEADYAGFTNRLSEPARKFVKALQENPSGVVADKMARLIGLENSVQIGGVTGGGMAKIANRFNVDLNDIYITEKRWAGGMRQTTYKPGPTIDQVKLAQPSRSDEKDAD